MLVEGIIRYSEKSAIPKKEAVMQSWVENSILRTHTLLSLSVFLRLNAGLSIASEALPQCIAAALTAFNTGDRVPGHDEALSGWVLGQARANPALVKSILREMWVSCASIKKGHLPGFYELSRDPASRQFLASLSADVLKTGINEDHDTVGKLVSALLTYDQGSALTIGEDELARSELSAKVRVIWHTALFVIDPIIYLEPWKNYLAATDTPIWEAIKVIVGDGLETRKAVSLTSEQRMEIVRSVGCRFSYVGHPIGAWSGNENSWDVAAFVVKQIKQLAAEITPYNDSYLKRLEDDGGLTSYRDEIRHQRAQYVKQQRDRALHLHRLGMLHGLLRMVLPQLQATSWLLSWTIPTRSRENWLGRKEKDTVPIGTRVDENSLSRRAKRFAQGFWQMICRTGYGPMILLWG